MTTTELKEKIESSIYDNSNQDIKGNTLQDVLIDMLGNDDYINRNEFIGFNENEVVVIGASGSLKSSNIILDDVKGIQGETGAQGQTGVRGYQGATGPAGITGPSGIQGETGPRGWQGDIGPTGERGATGPRGPVGPPGEGGISIPGATGPQGPKGDKGANGDKGEKGDPGSIIKYNQIYPVKSVLLGEIIIDGESNKIYSPMIINKIEHESTYVVSENDRDFLNEFIENKHCITTFENISFISKDVLDSCTISHDNYTLVIDRTDLYSNYYVYYHIMEYGEKDALEIYDKNISKLFTNTDKLKFILFNNKSSYIVLCYTDAQIGLFDITEKL